MTHGAVPVVSRFPGCLLEGIYREDETALTFPIGDTRGAAAAVRRLHEDPPLWERLSQNAASSQSGRFSDEGAVEEWASAFDAALERPPRRGARVPTVDAPSSGRLETVCGPAVADILRRASGRRPYQPTPGSEWPHTGSKRSNRLPEIGRFAAEHAETASDRLETRPATPEVAG
jgi:hypothetical protein